MSENEIIFPSRGNFISAECQKPPLGGGEVRGRTLTSLVSPGTELAWASGEDFPVRPGYAAVFEVEECGKDVTDIDIGARLFCMGPHRSFQQVDHRFTLPVPEGLDAETAVIARLIGVSMTTLMTTKARPGDRVIISGAGPVGYLAAHIFKLSGYEVAVIEPDTTRRAQVEASGISATFTDMPTEHPDFSGKVALVVDCSGHEKAVLNGCRIVRQHGEVVLIGVPWKKHTELYAHDILHAVFNNFVLLRSGWEWEYPLVSKAFKWTELLEGYNNSPQSIFSGFAKALQWLSQNRIPLAQLVKTTSPADPSVVYGALLERTIPEPFVVFEWQ
jgi:threonine dehydrogenase-like Zn-dependent dehydrogenase